MRGLINAPALFDNHSFGEAVQKLRPLWTVFPPWKRNTLFSPKWIDELVMFTVILDEKAADDRRVLVCLRLDRA